MMTAAMMRGVRRIDAKRDLWCGYALVGREVRKQVLLWIELHVAIVRRRIEVIREQHEAGFGVDGV